jgi:uncharacterized RDD family membrane protein YckC
VGMNQSGQPGAGAMATADFMTRVVAFIIDGAILWVANYIVNAILFSILIVPLGGLYVVVEGLVIAAISAGYFIYMWTTRKQTVGMILMKLQVVKDGTGAALTQPEAIRRWLYLGLPLALSALLSVGAGLYAGLGGLFILFTLAFVVAIASIAWQLYMAYATNNDARKQGPHDKAAGSVVVAIGPSPLAGMGGQKPS